MRALLFLVPLIPLFLSSQNGWSSTENETSQPKEVKNVPAGIIDQPLLPVIYEGGEKFKYDISWTGGVKIGEAHIEINATDYTRDQYEIRVRVTSDNGIFAWVYPVDDLHVTLVEGPQRLPVRHESWQKEGYNYESHKVTKYMQEMGSFLYWHNEQPARMHEFIAPVHNEFSSFLASRVMFVETGKPFTVPAWADDKRNEVVVEVMGTTSLKKTVFGPVDTIQIMPILTFSGTYDQRGDTIIWYTNDECRIPVKVNSKIVIGSLTATLVE